MRQSVPPPEGLNVHCEISVNGCVVRRVVVGNLSAEEMDTLQPLVRGGLQLETTQSKLTRWIATLPNSKTEHNRNL